MAAEILERANRPSIIFTNREDGSVLLTIKKLGGERILIINQSCTINLIPEILDRNLFINQRLERMPQRFLGLNPELFERAVHRHLPERIIDYNIHQVF